MYHVYVLRSQKDTRPYTGVTVNLARRIREHNAGKVHSTSARRPLVLAYSEAFKTKAEALARESYFKTAKGGALQQKLARLLSDYPK